MQRRRTAPVTFCLVAFLVLQAASCAHAAAIERLGDARWGVTEEIRLSNPTADARRLELYIPLVPDESPCQEVLAKSLPSAPARIFHDQHGNRVGIWVATVPPHGRKTVRFFYKVRAGHVRWREDLPGRLEAPGDTGRCLAPQELVESRSKTVLDAARAICAGESRPMYKALLLYDHILTHFRFDPRTAIYGAEESLGKSSLQCADAALLYVALARATSIPARPVGGLFITPGKTRYDEYHLWAEAALPGLAWAPVDPTLGRFDPGHRLQCFLEKRSCYIVLWRGSHRPFSVRHPRSRGPRTEISIVFDVQPLPGGASSPSTALTRIPEHYRAFPPPGRPFRAPAPSAGAISHFHRGNAHVRAGQDADAVSHYFCALAASSGYLEPCRELLRLHAEGRRAREILEGFSRLDTPLGWYARGELARRGNRYSLSRSLLARAEAAGFTPGCLSLSLMRLFARTKEIGLFERALTAAASLDRGGVDGYREALLFYQGLERWEFCLYWARKGAARFPRDATFPAMEGFSLLQRGELKEARAALEKAIRIDSSCGWYHCILGWVLVKSGDMRGARAAIERGIRLGRGVANPDFFRNLLEAR